jgi:hypothetical protein
MLAVSSVPRTTTTTTEKLEGTDISLIVFGYQEWGYYHPPLPKSRAQEDLDAMEKKPQPAGTTCRDCSKAVKKMYPGDRGAWEVSMKAKDGQAKFRDQLREGLRDKVGVGCPVI